MNDSRLVKKIMLRTIDEDNQRGRPRAIRQLSGKGTYWLPCLNQNNQARWRQSVNQAVDTNGYSTGGDE